MTRESDRPVARGLGARPPRLRLGAALVGLALSPVQTHAASQAGEAGSARPFEILDNSFFIEEGFNQEPGVFQNILGFVRSDRGNWEFAFTQEWPVGAQRHQLSYTIPFAGGDGASGVGDMFLHYRLQALAETKARPAFSPRFSLILPTGDEEDGLGKGHVGAQANLPFSKQVQDVYLHGNAGLTYERGSGLDLWTPNLGVSAIWRVRPMVNVMVETVALLEEVERGPGTTIRETIWLLSPGVRAGWNLGDHQVVLGGALAFGLTDASDDVAVFGYFSYELPFRR